MSVRDAVNTVVGDVERNSVLLALAVAFVFFAVTTAAVWIRDWWRDGRLPEHEIERAMAQADWYRWERQLAGQHEPPDDPAP